MTALAEPTEPVSAHPVAVTAPPVDPPPIAARTTLGPRKIDPREPEVRLAALLDEGSIVYLHHPDTSGVQAARGRIDGAKVIVYITDGTRQGGALGYAGCHHIVDAIDTAVRERVPVIGLWHSGGARIAEGVEALDGVGQVFAAMVRASGRVPQISVVLGPAAGGAAYGPALTDIVIMAPEGRVFVTGPDVVKSVTGEQIDMESLGGPGTHGRKSGVVHIVADSEADAYVRARRVTLLFSRPGIAGIAGMSDDPELGTLLPVEKQRAYNVEAAHRPAAGRADGGAPGEVGAQHRDRSRPAGRPERRRGGQQPASAGRLPGFDVRGEGWAASSGCATRSGSRCW